MGKKVVSGLFYIKMVRRVKKAHFLKVKKMGFGIAGMKMVFKNQKENTLMVTEKDYGNIGI